MAAFDRLPLQEFATLRNQGNSWPSGLYMDDTHAYVSDLTAQKVFAYLRSTRFPDTSRDFDTLRDAGNTAPAGIWGDGNVLFVADVSAGRIFAYDFATKARIAVYDIILERINDEPPMIGGIWGNDAVIYVVYTNINHVAVYNRVTRQRATTLEFGPDDIPTALDAIWGVWSNGTIIWIGDNDEKTIYAFERRTKARRPELDFEEIEARQPRFDISARSWRAQIPAQPTYTQTDPVTQETFTTGKLDKIEITNGGEGYVTPRMTVAEPTGEGLQAQVIPLKYDGIISTVAVENAGSGYTVAPNVVISGGGGIGAKLRAVLSPQGAVSRIEVVDGGRGYSTTPTITIASSPPPAYASNARAGHVTRKNGVIVGYLLRSRGSGYTEAPEVTISDDAGQGTGATATATIIDVTDTRTLPIPPPSAYDTARTNRIAELRRIYHQTLNFDAVGLAVTGDYTYGLGRPGYVTVLGAPRTEAVPHSSFDRYTNDTVARDITHDGNKLYVLLTDPSGRSAVYAFQAGARSTGSITWAAMAVLHPNTIFTGIAWDGESLLLAEEGTKTIHAITNGAIDTTKRIPGEVVKGISATPDITALAHDGQSLLILDAFTKGVYGFTGGHRDPSKDISPTSLLAANSDIDPIGLAYNDGLVWVMTYGLVTGARQHTQVTDAGRAGTAYAFKSILRSERRDTDFDLSDVTLKMASSTIRPSGVAVDDEGDALVLDHRNRTIRAFSFAKERTAARNTERDLGAEALQGTDVTARIDVGQVGWDGTRYYVVDRSESRIVAMTGSTRLRDNAYTLDESTLRSALITYGYQGPLTIGGICWDGSALWVLFSDAAVAAAFTYAGGFWTPSTSKRFRVTGIASPVGIAWDGTRLRIGDGVVPQVLVFEPSGVRHNEGDMLLAEFTALETDFTIGGVAAIGTSTLLVLNAAAPSIYGFTLAAGARDASFDIGVNVLHAASSIFWASGIAYDGSRVLVANSYVDGVLGFEWSAPAAAGRVSAKDVPQSVLTSANASINPQAIAWDGEHYLVGHDERNTGSGATEQSHSAVYAFTTTGRYTAGDIAPNVLAANTPDFRIGGMAMKDGRLYIWDQSLRKVFAFQDGARVHQWDVDTDEIARAAQNIIGTGLAWLGDVLYVLDGDADRAYAFRQIQSSTGAGYAYEPLLDVSNRLMQTALSTITPTGLAGSGEALLVADQSGAVFGFDPAEQADAPFVEVEAPQGFAAEGDAMYLVGGGSQDRIFAFEMPATPQAPRFPVSTQIPELLAFQQAINIQVPAASGVPSPTYSIEAANLPAGATFNADTRVISGAINFADPRTGTIIVTASNAYGTAQYRIPWRSQVVVNANFGQRDYDVTGTVGSALNYTMPRTAGYPEPTYSLLSGSYGGLSVDASTGKLTGTPAAPTGRRLVYVWQAEYASGTQRIFDTNIYLTIAAAPTTPVAPAFVEATRAPVTWSEGVRGTEVEIPAATGTPAPAYTAYGLPPGVRFDSNTRQVIPFAPERQGSGTIRIVASSLPRLGTAEFRFDYTVLPSTVRAAPGWNTPGPSYRWNIGNTLNLQLARVDFGAPRHEIVYTVEGLPVGLVFHADTLTVTGVLQARDRGTIIVTATLGTQTATREYPWVVGYHPPDFGVDALPLQIWVADIVVNPYQLPRA